MYQGKYANKSRRMRKRTGSLLLSALLLVTLSVSGTLALLVTKTPEVENTFTPSHVSCEVTEGFDGKTKTSVNVKNTSDIPAYIRVKLLSYRVNDEGQKIGGIATVPEFTPGAGWVLRDDGFYYYTKPVAVGASPAADLAESLTLTGQYKDVDGGRQVIEVMAEAIQADGVSSTTQDPAYIAAWNISKF